MPKHEPEMPHTQTSAPVAPARSTEEAFPRDTPDERDPRREAGEAGDASGEHGDRMPKGADEPGAGL